MLADRGCQLYKNALSEENRKERSQRVLSVNANGSWYDRCPLVAGLYSKYRSSYFDVTYSFRLREQAEGYSFSHNFIERSSYFIRMYYFGNRSQESVRLPFENQSGYRSVLKFETPRSQAENLFYVRFTFTFYTQPEGAKNIISLFIMGKTAAFYTVVVLFFKLQWRIQHENYRRLSSHCPLLCCRYFYYGIVGTMLMQFHPGWQVNESVILQIMTSKTMSCPC